MYYKLHGDSAHPALVLISGLKADHLNWATIVDDLSKHFYVLVFDNRGVGRNQSSLVEVTIERMADELSALIDQLSLKKPHVLGHSMGGAIAQTFAMKYPHKMNKLMLCNTFIKLNAVSRVAFEVILDMHRAGFSPGAIIKAIIPWGFSADFIDRTPGIVETIVALCDQAAFPQTTAGYHAQLTALTQFDASAFVANISHDTLIMASQDDIITPVRESEALHKAIRGSRLVILPGGHASSIEEPQLFVREVLGFLEDE